MARRPCAVLAVLPVLVVRFLRQLAITLTARSCRCQVLKVLLVLLFPGGVRLAGQAAPTLLLQPGQLVVDLHRTSLLDIVFILLQELRLVAEGFSQARRLEPWQV